MSVVDATWFESLNSFFKAQECSFQKKMKEKLRGFLNLSAGKASALLDFLPNIDHETLRENRHAVWEWHCAGSTGISPFLPPRFPVQYFIAKFGPISIGIDDLPPTAENFIPANFHADVLTFSTRKVGFGEYYSYASLNSFETYSLLASELQLKPSERYLHSFFGIVEVFSYGKIVASFHVTTLEDIARSTTSGLYGTPKLPDVAEHAFKPLDEKEEVAQRIAWFESELALIEASIILPAFEASSIANLWLRRDTLYNRKDPKALTWRGETEYRIIPREGRKLNFRTFSKISISLGGIPMNFPAFDFIQTWFNDRIKPFKPDNEPDPGDAQDSGIGRLHFILSECIRQHEKLANARDHPDENQTVKQWKVSAKCGGLERDLNTSLENLSVYDPACNPGGIFLCPTYLPSHMMRLCEWFVANLPELKPADDGSFKVHFIHIDSEGEFFQLHTETGGSIIIFTGMNMKVERELVDQVRFKYRLDVSSIWKDLEELTKEICREYTLSRLDVVFGGDRAACPLASHSDKKKGDEVLPWMDSDITGWYWFIRGRPGLDFFCTRSIDREAEKRVVEQGPLGFKSLVDCGPAWLQGPREICLCRKFFGDDWLRTCEPAHPQIWHGYPQSGAVCSKNLSRDKLDWTILYYSVADLVKAKMLTQLQDTVDIEIVTPFFEV